MQIAFVTCIFEQLKTVSFQIGAESHGERRQMCCGCSTKRMGVPLSASVVEVLDKNACPLSYELELRVLPFINGVVTITEAGAVHVSALDRKTR